MRIKSRQGRNKNINIRTHTRVSLIMQWLEEPERSRLQLKDSALVGDTRQPIRFTEKLWYCQHYTTGPGSHRTTLEGLQKRTCVEHQGRLIVLKYTLQSFGKIVCECLHGLN